MNSFICGIPLIASLFACSIDEPLAVGYIEGEYVQVAPLETARIVNLAVYRGDRIKQGDLIAVLESEDAELAVQQAKANLQQISAELENLLIGKRPEEIAVIEAELRSARLQQSEAARNLTRLRGLANSQFVSTAQLDTAATAAETSSARVQEL
jgi:HlyD family secretion protein